MIARAFLSLLMTAGFLAAEDRVVIDFENAPITGRWIESWEDQGVRFTPARQPTRSQAKARLMFFPHIPSGRKGILSAMADESIPVRATFSRDVQSATFVFWGSTKTSARVEAFDSQHQLLDTVSIEVIPGRKTPGDPIPTFELTVKGEGIRHVEFSGPRAGEYLAADELRVCFGDSLKVKGE